MKTPAGPVILIDGECVLCNRFARFVLRRDHKKIFLFASQDPVLAGNMGIGDRGGNSILLWKSDAILDASDAVLFVLRQLGFPWNLFGMFRCVPRCMRDAVYFFIARNRYQWFGKVQSCGLLTPEEKSRFLEVDSLE